MKSDVNPYDLCWTSYLAQRARASFNTDRVQSMDICEGLSRVSWKLSCTVLRGEITGNGDSLLDKAIKGQKAKQPYAIAMKDGRPFGIGGLWENWKKPASGEWDGSSHSLSPPNDRTRSGISASCDELTG